MSEKWFDGYTRGRDDRGIWNRESGEWFEVEEVPIILNALETHAARLEEALRDLDLHYNSIMGLIKPMFGYQQYYWDKLIKEPKDKIAAALLSSSPAAGHEA